MNLFANKIKSVLNDTDAKQIALITQETGALRHTCYSDLRTDVEIACHKLLDMGVVKGMTAAMRYTNDYEVVILDLAMIVLGVKVFAIPDDPLFSLTDFDNYYEINFLIQSTDVSITHGTDPDFLCIEKFLNLKIYMFHSSDVNATDVTITYVFGSGTTGRPKCIEIILDNCLEDFRSFSNAFRISKHDRFFVFLPLSVLQQRVMIYSTLLRGGAVCLSKPEDMMKTIRQMKPTIFVAPPLLYETILGKFKVKITDLDRRTNGKIVDYLEGRSDGNTITRLFAKVLGIFLKRALGGHIRFMLVGMAMAKLSTIDFFNRSGLPLYEAYGLSETGIISINTPDNNKVGTVGKPLNQGTVEISSTGEILVLRKDNWSSRYLNVSVEENLESYPSAFVYATGDLGEFDSDGYLRLKGRKKTLIALSSGYKVQPEPLEGAVSNLPGVGHAVLLGQGRPFLVLIVSLADPTAEQTKREVDNYIDGYNSKVVSRGRIANVIYTKDPFTPQNGLLNRSLKVNRTNVELHFSMSIETIYKEKEAVFEV